MRVALVVLTILAMSATIGPAQEGLPAADRAAIRVVVEAQLAAFQRDDADTAFGFASPAIQAMFETPHRFMAMVRGGYPMVDRPRAVQFGEVVWLDGGRVQKVELIGPDGQAALALYPMQRRADGVWRINGCQLTESENVAA